jgi:hypothetical protein
MALLSILYLEVFVLINSICLWHRNLSGTAVEHISAHAPVHKAMYTVTIVVSPLCFSSSFVHSHSTILSSKFLFPWIAMVLYFICCGSRQQFIYLFYLQGLVFHTTRNEENDGRLS